MYDKLIFDVPLYVNAAARLYGVIDVKTLHDIYNSQNEPVSFEDFARAVEEATPTGQYWLLDDRDIFKQDLKVAPEGRLIVERSLGYATWDSLFTMEEAHEGLTPKIFDRETFMAHSIHSVVLPSPEVTAMKEYFTGREPEGIELRELVRETVLQAERDTPAALCLWDLQEWGFVFGDLADRKRFVALYKELFETVPKAIHFGYSDRELQALPVPEDVKVRRIIEWFLPAKLEDTFPATDEELMAPVTPTGKTRRQALMDKCYDCLMLPPRHFDLCPCTSGLLYKDCCGKR